MDFTNITLRFTKTDNSVHYQVYPSAPVAVTEDETSDELIAGLLSVAASQVLVENVEEVQEKMNQLLQEYLDEQQVSVDAPPSKRLH